jgi:peptidoglycan/LPS O-acetylase OafA/YrhL
MVSEKKDTGLMHVEAYPKDIRALTSLRFFAAAIIVFRHMTDPFYSIFNHWIFVSKAPLAVDFFFILSGFILTHVYSSIIMRGGGAVRTFYLRRFARLYPMHFVTLLAVPLIWLMYSACNCLPSWPASDTLLAFAANLFMVHAWGFVDGGSYNKPSWSISAEWFACLLFPLLTVFLAKIKSGSVVQFCFCVALFLVLYALSGPLMGRSLTQLDSYLGILRIIPEFMMGAALYNLGRHMLIRNCDLAQCGFLALIIIVFMVIGASDAIIVILFCPLILAVAEQARQKKKSWLSSNRMVYLGESSFALYMIHVPFLNIMICLLPITHSPSWSMGMLWFSIFPLLVLLSVCCYRWIERPARSWVISIERGRWKKIFSDSPDEIERMMHDS